MGISAVEPSKVHSLDHWEKFAHEHISGTRTYSINAKIEQTVGVQAAQLVIVTTM